MVSLFKSNQGGKGIEHCCVTHAKTHFAPNPHFSSAFMFTERSLKQSFSSLAALWNHLGTLKSPCT